MTGTSMDGIDISLVQTNGLHLKRLIRIISMNTILKQKKH